MSMRSEEQSSFLFGANSAFIEQLYQRYLSSPNSVDASWQQFFASLGDEADDVAVEARGASWSPKTAMEMPADPYGVLDGDGAVDVTDLLLVLQWWGPCPGDCPSDIDGSGTVDVLDLLVVLAHWGACG